MDEIIVPAMDSPPPLHDPPPLRLPAESYVALQS